MKPNNLRVQLIGAFKAFVNGQFLKSFNITSIGSIKNCKKMLVTFLFSHNFSKYDLLTNALKTSINFFYELIKVAFLFHIIFKIVTLNHDFPYFFVSMYYVRDSVYYSIWMKFLYKV